MRGHSAAARADAKSLADKVSRNLADADAPERDVINATLASMKKLDERTDRETGGGGRWARIGLAGSGVVGPDQTCWP